MAVKTWSCSCCRSPQPPAAQWKLCGIVINAAPPALPEAMHARSLQSAAHSTAVGHVQSCIAGPAATTQQELVCDAWETRPQVRAQAASEPPQSAHPYSSACLPVLSGCCCCKGSVMLFQAGGSQSAGELLGCRAAEAAAQPAARYQQQPKLSSYLCKPCWRCGTTIARSAVALVPCCRNANESLMRREFQDALQLESPHHLSCSLLQHWLFHEILHRCAMLNM